MMISPAHRYPVEERVYTAPTEIDENTGLPLGMTRGILELAAERLAAAAIARTREVEEEPIPEPEPVAEIEPAREIRRRPRAARSAGAEHVAHVAEPAPPAAEWDDGAQTYAGWDAEPQNYAEWSAEPQNYAEWTEEAQANAGWVDDAPVDEAPPVEEMSVGEVPPRGWDGGTAVENEAGWLSGAEAEPERRAGRDAVAGWLGAGADRQQTVEEPRRESVGAVWGTELNRLAGKETRPRRGTELEPRRVAPAEVTQVVPAPSAWQEEPAARTAELPRVTESPAELPRAAEPSARPEADPEIEEVPEAPDNWFWTPGERQVAGLPATLRLPTGLPDDRWHPAMEEPVLAVPVHAPVHPEPIAIEAPPIQEEPPIQEAPPIQEEPPIREALPVQEAPRIPEPLPVAEEPVRSEDYGLPLAERFAHAQARAGASAYRPAGIELIRPEQSVATEPEEDDSFEFEPEPETKKRRTLRQRRRTTVMAYLMIVALVLVVGHQLREQQQRPTAADRQAAQRAAQPAQPEQPIAEQPAAEQPDDEKIGKAEGVEQEETGEAGEFRYAKSRGPLLGTAGSLHRFKVAVEETVPDVKPADFADMIDDTLGDQRSWIHGGRLELRRVPDGASNAEFTVYLASAATSERMCAAGGLQTEGFTSCRVPGKVVINAERWADAIPDYDGKLDDYRRYAINHEVGHQLGHGHETCPGKGRPAPVMMQQTYGLEECTPNSWPFRDGKRYQGEPVS
ncbi:DUF3152 domain-containing protein [Actinoplanes sp. NPDC051851]|uniref:DUF3152 domain-containing protein n=1 Tax=Actinoplanes sp. NPDC051851 TaxID=3154753 RepID=UPI00343B1F1B